MMLVEQGRLALNDPVAKYIPDFKDVKVGEEKRTPTARRRWTWSRRKPADDRPGPDAPHLRPHLRLLRRGRGQEGLPRGQPQRRRSDNGEFVERVSPSCRWSISPARPGSTASATDVLGRVIEVVAGKPLYQAFREMLLDPLGMTDTSFYVTDPAKQPAHRRAVRRTTARSAPAPIVNDPRVAAQV